MHSGQAKAAFEIPSPEPIRSPFHSEEESREFPPRGVSPRILISQIRNTIPFLFESEDVQAAAYRREPYLRTILDLDQRLSEGGSEPELSHADYFTLCLSAHAATVGSFVPTDVDNQIRFRLWHPSLQDSTVFRMVDRVLENHGWDFRKVTTRWVECPETGELLGGHHGEWFSTAVGAYGALRRRAPERAEEIRARILGEMDREARMFQALKKARDGVGLLKAATIIAHNLGDLDRVIDLWNLPEDDALRMSAYKSGHIGAGKSGAILEEAGRLNKAFMADENHRHFALRGPKCLRRSADFLLPIGPFFDTWGKIVARHPGLKPEEVGETVQALVLGWERLPKTVGYARALSGILETFPGGAQELSHYIPSRIARSLKSGLLRQLCAVSQARFEEQWAQKAMNFSKSGSVS